MKVNLFKSLLVVIIFLFLSPAKIFAQETIKNFDVSVTAHKDGSMTVEESIDYDFGSDYRHGIFRKIPLVSGVGELYRIIEVEFSDIERNGKNEKYEIDRQPKETVVKIGNPDKTISGLHNYLIKYTVKNGIGSNYEDHDEIYWNATGNNWEIQIGKASINLSTDFGISPDKVACFTRSADINGQFCTFPDNPPFNPVVTNNVLKPGEGLTVVYGFPVNTFPKSVLQKNEPSFDPDFLTFLKIYLPVVLILNFLLAPYLIFWYFKTKSKTRFGKPVVNFDIPKNISPLEAGIIDNHILERNDVVATIFDLAIRKYIKIVEVKIVKTLMPDKFDIKIVKFKNSDGLNDFEKTLLERLFNDGNEVKLEELKKDFYMTFDSLEKQSFKMLVDKKLYTKNPKNQMALLLIFGIITLVLGNIILGPVLIFLSRKLNGRTEAGDKIDFEVDGLKIFLKAVSRYHKFQSENLITVEKYIPFAIALGLQDEFMEQLKIIHPDYKPSWYFGSHGFYYMYPGMYSSFSSNVTTSAPSSSSGFSGGSSGGGGGGGGGGSW